MQSTLAKLSLCRTAALGERTYHCPACDQGCVVYNSCGDRHCPTCSGTKRADWMESASDLILDGLSYYQVVFTLPSQLSRLALGNRAEIYDLLFRASWSALQIQIRQEQAYDPAALMVLHTWNQKLAAHAHIHAVVPGAGPGLAGDSWRVSQRGDDASSVGRYLVNADELRRQFRDHFLRGFERLLKRGKLKLTGEFRPLQTAAGREKLLQELRDVTWVSYIEPPPTAACRAETVLKYLARYLTGGPISDARILAANEQEVTFLAREGKVAGGESKQVPITVSTTEFVRLWSLHILPKGYTKTRRYGGWSNTRRDIYLETCRQHVPVHEGQVLDDSLDRDPLLDPLGETVAEVDIPAAPCCSGCGRSMILQGERRQRSWWEVMTSPSRPTWYRQHERH